MLSNWGLIDTMSSPPPDTSSRILAAALKLLLTKDGKGVRMSDVARLAGISRQALYLHFDSRAKLLIAATLYLDDQLGVDARLLPSRTAKTGIDRLNAFIDAWSAYIPEIYGLAKALISLAETDPDAAAAWATRMQDMREGCEAAIDALVRDNMLSTSFSAKDATDLLWIMLSVRNWEIARQDCGWSPKKHGDMLKTAANHLFVKPG